MTKEEILVMIRELREKTLSERLHRAESAKDAESRLSEDKAVRHWAVVNCLDFVLVDLDALIAAAEKPEERDA